MNSPQWTACLENDYSKSMLMLRGHRSLLILLPFDSAETRHGTRDRHLSNLILARLGPAFARQSFYLDMTGSEITTLKFLVSWIFMLAGVANYITVALKWWLCPFFPGKSSWNWHHTDTTITSWTDCSERKLRSWEICIGNWAGTLESKN